MLGAEKAKRRYAVSFTWHLLKQVLRLMAQSLLAFGPTSSFANRFFEIYSDLWDLAEHSISHSGFNLPSALGAAPVNFVNQQLAQLYGMKFANLSFGGTSGALLTILTAILPKRFPDRDIILFDDICHQSAIGGIIFGRWKAVRLARTLHPDHHTAYPLSVQTVINAVDTYGAARIAAIILVLPSYDGFRSPSEDRKIYEFAKQNDITVIIDGAWDALRFRQIDQSKISLPSLCDIWISSPHKRGLTPSSLGCFLTDDEKIARLWDEALDLGFRSSSVSFVEIMIAEHRLSQILAGDWNDAFEAAEQAAKDLRRRLSEVHPELYCVVPDHLNAEAGDVTHILISTEKIAGLDARDWASTLSNHFGLDVEKATASNLLLLCGSPGHLKQIDLTLSTLRRALDLTLQQKQGALR